LCDESFAHASVARRAELRMLLRASTRGVQAERGPTPWAPMLALYVPLGSASVWPSSVARTFAAAPKRTENAAAVNDRVEPAGSVPSKRSVPLDEPRRTEIQVSRRAVNWSRRALAACVVVGVGRVGVRRVAAGGGAGATGVVVAAVPTGGLAVVVGSGCGATAFVTGLAPDCAGLFTTTITPARIAMRMRPATKKSRSIRVSGMAAG